MADLRAPKSGINADVEKKLEELYDEDLEFEVREWLEAVAQEPLPEPDQAAMEALESKEKKGAALYGSLRDGSYLCRFLKALNPKWQVEGKLLKPSKNAFSQRETIGKFLDGCKQYGVDENSLFETESLHAACNLNMVLTTIVALGSVAQGKEDYDGPQFGPKRAERQERQFTAEKLAEGKAIIGLQMGSNQGASQSGMTPYGLGRQVYDGKQ